MTSNLSIRRPPTVAKGAQTITYYLWRAVLAVALMTAGFFPTSASHSTMMAVPRSAVLGGLLCPPELHNIADDTSLHHLQVPCDSSISLKASIRLLQPARWEFPCYSTTCITDVDGATRVEKRLHHGSAVVAQASGRVWMDDFCQDPPMNRQLASRSRRLGNRTI